MMRTISGMRPVLTHIIDQLISPVYNVFAVHAIKKGFACPTSGIRHGSCIPMGFQMCRAGVIIVI